MLYGQRMKMGYILFVMLFAMLYLSSTGNAFSNSNTKSETMSTLEKNQLKNTVKEMFYHAYNSYMNHAYPADELMPLSCKGRYKGSEPNRGDIDETLGNFSLTLVDTLDTLAILGDLDEFENAARKIIDVVKFDSDIVVSVFETNIRMLGGLLSGHIMASYIHDRMSRMDWYTGQLLSMAKDLGYRLLPAFNTTTGIPTPKINLKYGLNSQNLGHMRETCTACAGTMILEFAALSRLSGESVFEEKARKAMDSLWELRHRSSDLMGTVLNIHNGDWVRRESGVGAGIDSYYEYCLKAYILLGDETYLNRFNTHYSAVMKYISQGPLLLDVHMHRPHTNSRNFMDALLAFWPGLQVLKGDIKPAIETHEMLYQVIKKHNFLPEAFTTDFQVHWGQHPLRPEFVESTYFLYKATGDPYYLEAGKNVLQSLKQYAQVPCGFAAVKDVRTGTHEDRMDSFVLAETFKYLYLLFADDKDLIFNIDDFVFTTEAHLFPLTLARLSNASVIPLSDNISDYNHDTVEEDFDRSCPTTSYLFPGNRNYAHSVRKPLQNMVEKRCPKTNAIQRKLKVEEFQATNEEHLNMLQKMGISVIMIDGGKVQLVQSYSQASSREDAEEGLLFMKDMIEFSKQQGTPADPQLRTVMIKSSDSSLITLLNGGPAQFGGTLNDNEEIVGNVMIGEPLKACSPLTNTEEIIGKIAIVQRGDCMFVEKARNIQNSGAIAGIVIDNHPDTSSENLPFFAMSGDGSTDIVIPLVFLFTVEAEILLSTFKSDPQMLVSMADIPGSKNEETTEVKSPEKNFSDESKPSKVQLDVDNVSEMFGNKDFVMQILNKLSKDIKNIKKGFGKSEATPETSKDAGSVPENSLLSQGDCVGRDHPSHCASKNEFLFANNFTPNPAIKSEHFTVYISSTNTCHGPEIQEYNNIESAFSFSDKAQSTIIQDNS